MFSGMRLFSRAFLPVLLLCTFAPAQSPQDPSSKASQELQQWRASRAAQLTDDFGELARYRNADANLGPPAPGDNRVVFLGDSITDSWDLVKYFPGKPYINRGISGQTTPQMLVRFRQDVLDLQPRVVVILAGTNDIAGNTGPITLDQIEANYASMAELARAHKIRVVFSSVTPVNGYTEKAQRFFPLRSPQEILELNRWMKDYASANGDIYLDYFDAMVDDDGFLKRTLSEDGLHPNDAGYKVMTPLAEKAIQQALNASSKSATQ